MKLNVQGWNWKKKSIEKITIERIGTKLDIKIQWK
jgi:hypothetical protein